MIPSKSALKQHIRSLGERLDSHRKRQQKRHPCLTLTGIYNVLEKLRSGEPLTAKEKQIHDQGLVTVLRQIHDELDEAVLEAYGWQDLTANGTHCSVGLRSSLANEQAPSPVPNGIDAHRAPLQGTSSAIESELLSRLVALNHARAAEEKRGQIRWLRPDYQNPNAAASQPVQATLAGTEASSSHPQSTIHDPQSTIHDPRSTISGMAGTPPRPSHPHPPTPRQRPRRHRRTTLRPLRPQEPEAHRADRGHHRDVARIGAGVRSHSTPPLQSSSANGRFPSLSNEQNPHHSAGSAGSNVRGLPEDPLESAIAFVGGNARTTGEEPFGIRRKAAIIQRAALIHWAEKSGLIASPSQWEGKAVIGGSEHDIWEMDGEVWKVTRPDRFGWTVLPGEDGAPHIAEATPLE